MKSKVLSVCMDGGSEEWEYTNEGRLLYRQIIGWPELEHVLGEEKGRDKFLRHGRAKFSYE